MKNLLPQICHRGTERTERNDLNNSQAAGCRLCVLCASVAFLLAGCATTPAEPLPATVPPLAVITPPSYSANIVAYRVRYLTNTAPDFAAGVASGNWTRLPDTTSAQDTNVSLATVPHGSLLVAASDFTKPVVAFVPAIGTLTLTLKP